MTDLELKQALARMLPEKVETNLFPCVINWRQAAWGGKEVLDTELLHLCGLVEETLDGVGYCRCLLEVCLPELDGVIVGLNAGYGMTILHATWQQRTIALCKLKGITI